MATKSMPVSGFDALEMIEAHGADSYDVVFVDMKMPGMNGMELTRRIRDLSSAKPIIMISAMEWDDIEAQAQDAGVSWFLPKPLFPSAIVDSVNRCLNPDRCLAPAIKEEADQHDFTGYRILLAEDVEINSEILMSLLEPTGIAIDCAENGTIAVEKFVGSPEIYDMIFMDIHMPEKDGYEATAAIRALEMEKAKAIPIIAMTANVFREDVERCLATGMNDHVGKPLDIEEVIRKLVQYLPKR